jgi:hypothetical protein
MSTITISPFVAATGDGGDGGDGGRDDGGGIIGSVVTSTTAAAAPSVVAVTAVLASRQNLALLSADVATAVAASTIPQRKVDADSSGPATMRHARSGLVANFGSIKSWLSGANLELAGM